MVRLRRCPDVVLREPVSILRTLVRTTRTGPGGGAGSAWRSAPPRGNYRVT